MFWAVKQFYVNNTYTSARDPSTGEIQAPAGVRQIDVHQGMSGTQNNGFRRRHHMHAEWGYRRRHHQFPYSADCAPQCDRHRQTEWITYQLPEQSKSDETLAHLDFQWYVRAQDNVTTLQYYIRVQRMADDADLKSGNEGLNILAGGVKLPATPLVQKQVVDYTIAIAASIGSVQVLVVPSDWRATKIEVNGRPVRYGVAGRSYGIELYGSARFEIQVWAHDDRVSKTYTLTVVRGVAVMNTFGDVGQISTGDSKGWYKGTDVYPEGAPGGRKWWGGAVDSQGLFWGIPHNNDRILVTNTSNDTLLLMPPRLGGYEAVPGVRCNGVAIQVLGRRRSVEPARGMLGCQGLCDVDMTHGSGSCTAWSWWDDGGHYACHLYSSCELKTTDSSAHTYQRAFEDTLPAKYKTGGANAQQKWAGGVLVEFNTAPGYAGTNTSRLYGIPYDAPEVLEIDTMKRAVRTLGSFPGRQKWVGGVLAYNGYVYGIPFNSGAVLRVDPWLRSATTFGSVSSTIRKWWDGAFSPSTRLVIGIPHDASEVLAINTDTNAITTFGSLGHSQGKWAGGATAMDGRVFGCPYDADQVLVVHPGSWGVHKLSQRHPGKAKWAHAVRAQNGLIYCGAATSTTMLVIDPFRNISSTLNEALPPVHPYSHPAAGVGSLVTSMESPEYVGCYKDGTHRDLMHAHHLGRYFEMRRTDLGKYTQTTPVQQCKRGCHGYSVYATQGDSCFCDNSYSTPPATYPKVPESECTGSTGGGNLRNSVYRAVYRRSGVFEGNLYAPWEQGRHYMGVALDAATNKADP